jgi:hypothetical protein
MTSGASVARRRKRFSSSSMEGGKNEAQHAVVGPQAPDLLPALVVDVKKAIDTSSDRLLHGCDAGAVAIAVHDGPFGELVAAIMRSKHSSLTKQ